MNELKKGEEYYTTGEGFVTYFGDVVGEDKYAKNFVVMLDGAGVVHVVRRSEVQKFSDTWEYQQRERRREELDNITKEAEANLDKIANKLVDMALKELSARIKLNVLFGTDTGAGSVGLTISNELTKLIKDKTKDKLKNKELF